MKRPRDWTVICPRSQPVMNAVVETCGRSSLSDFINEVEVDACRVNNNAAAHTLEALVGQEVAFRGMGDRRGVIMGVCPHINGSASTGRATYSDYTSESGSRSIAYPTSRPSLCFKYQRLPLVKVAEDNGVHFVPAEMLLLFGSSDNSIKTNVLILASIECSMSAPNVKFPTGMVGRMSLTSAVPEPIDPEPAAAAPQPMIMRLTHPPQELKNENILADKQNDALSEQVCYNDFFEILFRSHHLVVQLFTPLKQPRCDIGSNQYSNKSGNSSMTLVFTTKSLCCFLMTDSQFRVSCMLPSWSTEYVVAEATSTSAEPRRKIKKQLLPSSCWLHPYCRIKMILQVINK